MSLLNDNLPSIILLLLNILECPHHLLYRAVLLLIAYLLCLTIILRFSYISDAQGWPFVGVFTNTATSS